jgi:superfamily I DNA and RNA helicase
LEAACGVLLEDAEIPSLYDAILIDEGQDFGPNFYRACRRALRDPDEGSRKLIWAYDEAQTLGDLDITRLY